MEASVYTKHKKKTKLRVKKVQKIVSVKGKTPKRRILLVDDDTSLREVLCDLLESEGYTVDCVANGKEAILFLGSTQFLPGLILLDLMMPVMDGYEFRRIQQGTKKIAHIGVIVMTAGGRIAENDMWTDVIAVLQKPFSLDVLLSVIRQGYPLLK